MKRIHWILENLFYKWINRKIFRKNSGKWRRKTQKFIFKKFLKIQQQNSLNSEKITGIIGSSKILRRSHSTSDHYLTKSDSKPFRRSNSTGSAPNTNTNKLKKQQSLKQQKYEFDGNTKSCPKRKVKDNCKSNYNYSYENHYKNLRINPVLNLPSPYISRVSVDLFSFGSLFCNGAKDRKKNKWNMVFSIYSVSYCHLSCMQVPPALCRWVCLFMKLLYIYPQF